MTNPTIRVPRSKAAKNALFHIAVFLCVHAAFVSISNVLWAAGNLPGAAYALVYAFLVVCLSGYSVLLSAAALAYGLRDPRRLRVVALVFSAGAIILLLASLWMATPWHLMFQ